MNGLFDPSNVRDVVGLILFVLLAYCAGFMAGWWFRGKTDSAPLDPDDTNLPVGRPAYDPPAHHDH